MQRYTTHEGRINKIKGQILAHAIPVEVLGITGQMKRIPKNRGDTVIFRRYLPFGATTTDQDTQNRPVVDPSTHLTSEGVTPAADTITPVDVTVVLQQYSALYAFTDKLQDLYEDDIPAEMKQQVGERMGLLREMIRYGALKAGTNKFFAGGTSRATVAAAVSYNLLSLVARNLLANHGKLITNVLSPSANFNTAPVEPGYLVFCHTDCEHDIRALPGFKQAAEYGTRKLAHEMELGSLGRFRFIVSPELASIPDSGAAVGSTGLFSTSGSNIDVYPTIVVAQKAWGDVALRGSSSFTPTFISPGQMDKNDPLGQRGYAGAKFYSAAKMLNDGWAAVLEVGISDLD